MGNKTTVAGECPECKSTNIDYGSSSLCGDSLYYEAECRDCECDFKEYYDLVYSESILD